jgi:hypothetical protein
VIDFLDPNAVAWFIALCHTRPEVAFKVVTVDKAMDRIAINFYGSDPDRTVSILNGVRCNSAYSSTLNGSIVCPIHIVNIKGDILNEITMLGDQSCHGVSGSDWGGEKKLDIILLQQVSNFVLDSGFESVVTNDVESKGVLVKESGLSRI